MCKFTGQDQDLGDEIAYQNHKYPRNPLQSNCRFSHTILLNMAHTDKKSFEYIWKSMLAGGLAGLAAKTAIAPLDRVKILFQTQHPAFTSHSGSFMGGIAAIRQISSTQGVAGLFQGHSATVLRIVPYAAVKFMAYEQCKMFLMPQPSDESPARRFLAGAFAGSQFNQGCTSVFVSYPFDLLRVRMAFEAKASLWQTLSMVYHEPNRLWPHPSRSLAPLASLGNLYRGFMPTIYGMVPYAGVSFLYTIAYSGRTKQQNNTPCSKQPAQMLQATNSSLGFICFAVRFLE